VKHAGNECPKIAQLAIVIVRPFPHRQPRRERGNFLALIADTFQIRDRLEDGDNQPQVGGRRSPSGQDPAAVLVDGALELIDARLFLGDQYDRVRIRFSDTPEGLR
jgi:hypothetical protein